MNCSRVISVIFFMLSLFFVLMLLSPVSYGQLADSVLKQYCIKKYVTEEDTVSWEWFMLVNYAKEQKEQMEPMHLRDLDGTEIKFEPFHYIFRSVDELFRGFFEHYRIYMVNFSGSYQSTSWRSQFAKIYLIDAYSGKMERFNGLNAFNQFLKTSQKPVNVIDKSYLYWYFAMKFDDTLQVNANYFYRYPQKLQEGSVFANISNAALFSADLIGCWSYGRKEIVGLEQFFSYVPDASEFSLPLVIYESHLKGSFEKIIYKYTFSYNQEGYLKSIAVDTLR